MNIDCNTQELAFAEYFVEHGVIKYAYIHAYKPKTSNDGSIRALATRCFNRPHVKAKIKELQDLQTALFGLSLLDIQRVLAKTAVLGMSTKIDKQGNIVPINLAATVSAMQEINRMNGNHAPVKADLNVDHTVSEPRTLDDFYNDVEKLRAVSDQPISH